VNPQSAVDLAVRALGRPIDRAVVVFGVADTEFDENELRVLLRTAVHRRGELPEAPPSEGPGSGPEEGLEEMEWGKVAAVVGSAIAFRLRDEGVICYRRRGGAME